MLKNKIFSKIFGLIMLTSLATGMIFLLITFQDRIRLAEQAVIQKNKLLAEVTANMVVAGYLSGRWPFQTLKLISDSEAIVFLWIVKPDGEIYFADNPAMFGRLIEDPSLLSIDEPLIKDALSEEGEKVKLIVYPLKMELGEKPWALYLGASLKPIEVAMRETIVIGVIAVIAIIFLTGLISFYFSKRITRPLEQLRTGAIIIGKGDLGHQIKLKTGDEIEELGRAFNQMADDLRRSRVALEESKAVLEIKVKARTKELEGLTGELEDRVKERTGELRERIEELERFHKLTIGRELKMMELKRENKKLQAQLREANFFIEKHAAKSSKRKKGAK